MLRVLFCCELWICNLNFKLNSHPVEGLNRYNMCYVVLCSLCKLLTDATESLSCKEWRTIFVKPPNICVNLLQIFFGEWRTMSDGFGWLLKSCPLIDHLCLRNPRPGDISPRLWENQHRPSYR